MNKLPIAFLLLASCSPDPTPPPPKAAPETPGREPAMMAPPERPARPAGDIISFDAPASWVKEEPSSNMRKAQYKVPDKEKKAGDAQLALFYFGPNNEMLDDNVKRWAQQMGAADPNAQVIQGKCKITLVDLKGTYTGDQKAGPQENARLLAAVVEAADGPWYFKLVGPAETVGPWRDEFVALLKGAGGK
ncbi:MAG TPA: hypothetical protein VKW04_06255 [Planctomycetota bacterium]|nr:hypothetical protein [Planctomycetota bacterium]